MSGLERALYYAKYTVGSYADAIVSIPIWTTEKIAKASETVFGRNNPEFLSWSHITNRSEVYRGREKLRDSLDTRAGALYLQSNVIGVIPFVLVGMPVAELAQDGIEAYISRVPEIVQYATNSLVTLAAQMVAGYTTFMANEVRVNKHKYVDEAGRIKIRKIGIGLKNAVKAFLTFDLSYIGSKTIGQSVLLAQGKNPWKASALFDTIAFPAFWSLAVYLGLRNNVIETKQTMQWRDEEAIHSKLK